MAYPDIKIEPWQQEFIQRMQGVKPGELRIAMSGRQTGKSQMAKLINDLHRFANGIAVEKLHDLILTEGTVYGARYYCVEPVGGVWIDMETWSMDTFGAPGDRIWDSGPAPLPAKRWYMNNRKFWFRTQKDRDWFVLRWNS